VVAGEPRLQSGDLLSRKLEGVEVLGVQGLALADIDPRKCADLHELDLHTLLVWRAEAGVLADHFIARLDGGRLERGVRLERSRRSPEWTEYDGNLTRVVQGVSAGTGSHPVSATSLETWAACPLKYFLGHALRLKPPAEAEEAFEISPLDRGGLIHRILQVYFERVHAEGLATVEQRRHAMAEVVGAGLDHAETIYITGRRVIWRLERERIARDLLAFVDQEAEREARLGVRQTHAELAFGLAQAGRDAVTVELPGRSAIRFRGVIDRVEMSPDGQRAVVVDYKTGNDNPYGALKDHPVDRGRRLQLPIYAEAVRNRFEGLHEVGAQYWFVSERGGYRLIPEQPLSARGPMLAAVGAICDGIGGGTFIARPGARSQSGFDNCQICAFDRLCSSSRERHWEQKSADPRLARYRSLVDGQIGVQE
ncbi:MAG: PD-(D/E)XK nuclease family protein, partial [Chloroflexi bacterium]|nr:PD-(D/E)XK nuclease family protein [Chloroflexota bacterium]